MSKNFEDMTAKEKRAYVKSYKIAMPEKAKAMQEIRRSNKAGVIETGWRKRPRSFNKKEAIKFSLKND